MIHTTKYHVTYTFHDVDISAFCCPNQTIVYLCVMRAKLKRRKEWMSWHVHTDKHISSQPGQIKSINESLWLKHTCKILLLFFSFRPPETYKHKSGLFLTLDDIIHYIYSAVEKYARAHTNWKVAFFLILLLLFRFLVFWLAVIYFVFAALN